MRHPAVVAVILLLAVAAGAAFFLLRPEERQFEDVRALVAAIESRGITCGSPLLSGPNPTEDLVDFGACQINGKTVNLHVYKSEEALQEHITGNVAARAADNPNYFDYLIAGDTWVVDTYTEKTAKEIQAAIGGEIH